MIRKIIKIDEEKCDGCGICVTACHENAIEIIDGKAKLLRDDYCDGLGDCLPACPVNAIAFEEREALEYDEEAVFENIRKKSEAKSEEKKEESSNKLPCGCPGSNAKTIARKTEASQENTSHEISSMLNQWPVQIKLVPINAPYFQNANLLIAADCVAYAYGNFHGKFMKDKITLIGCPKLDDTEYAEKLTAIIKQNDIKSVSVVKMEVPCCTGLEISTRQALANSGKALPYSAITLSVNGEITV